MCLWLWLCWSVRAILNVSPSFLLLLAEAQQAVTPGAEVVDRSTGKKVGKVTTVLGPRGLALMRLEPALKQSAQLHIENNDGVSVKVMRPKWWPGEWGHEDEQQAASSVWGLLVTLPTILKPLYTHGLFQFCIFYIISQQPGSVFKMLQVLIHIGNFFALICGLWRLLDWQIELLQDVHKNS